MSDKLFPADYTPFTSMAPGDSLPMSSGGVYGPIDYLDLLASFNLSNGGSINVKALGAKGDGSTDDGAAIAAAWMVAQSMGWPIAALYFPPGTYRIINTALQLNASRSLWFGYGAILKTYGTSQVQLGDASHTPTSAEFTGVKFQTDAAASASAPVYIYSANALFRNVEWIGINKNLVALRAGSAQFLGGCRSSLAAGAVGGSVVAANVPSGQAAAIIVQSGNIFDGEVDSGQYAFDFTGAGHLDGIYSAGAGYGNYSGIVNYHPTSGGSVTNTQFYDNLIDQVGGKAFNFVPGAGSSLGDVDIAGNTINGSITDATTTGAIVSLDLTSGATHSATNFRVADNTFKDVRVRVMEVLGGTLKTVIFSRNSSADYGRVYTLAGALTGRMLYVAGTIDCLEVVDNHSRTTLAHDYDVEFGAVTITKSKIEGNTFRGTAATLSEFSNYSFHSRRTRLSGALTLFVRTDGADTNTGLNNTAAGAFRTVQAAIDYIAGAYDMNNQTVTIQLSDNTVGVPTYASVTITKKPIGGGTIQIKGNPSTPGNVIIAGSSADAVKLAVATDTIIYVRDMQLQTTTSGWCLNCVARAQLQFGNIVFAAGASGHIIAQAPGAEVTGIVNYSITAGAPVHALAAFQGTVTLVSRTVTLTGTPVLTNFAVANLLGSVRVDAMTFIGSATGNRYSASSNGTIYTNGGGASYLPGNAAGATSTGGQYI